MCVDSPFPQDSVLWSFSVGDVPAEGRGQPCRGITSLAMALPALPWPCQPVPAPSLAGLVSVPLLPITLRHGSDISLLQ